MEDYEDVSYQTNSMFYVGFREELTEQMR